MNKVTLEPGRKYKGTFWVNEYGEIQVRPEQKGSRPGNLKLVTENEHVKIYESNKLFKMTIMFDKQDTIQQVVNRVSSANLTLLNYFKPQPK